MNCNYTFPKRQVHLDFHTSPDIPGIGSNYSKENFQAALKAGNLDSITVFAKQATETINVIYDNIKILIDGVEYTAKDANGNVIEPFIYNGTTYLPVRAVSNALGKAVYWDGPNYTVYLGDMGGKLEYPTVELEEMTSIAHEPYSTNKLTDNYDNKYERAIWNARNRYKFNYLLNMKYSEFRATLYIPKGTSSNEVGYLKIVADGKTVYTSPEMTKHSAPINISVNIKGCNDLKIEFSTIESTYQGGIDMCLGEAGFYQ